MPPNSSPIICFGQQPCGFFPKRFLVAKVNTARRLKRELGANSRIVFFYHDSDADYRETITIFRDRSTGAEVRLNFLQENKLQKKFSPLYAKRVPVGWKEEILKQLPRFVNQEMIDIFKSANAKTVADSCLEMYKKMGLLDEIEIVRSGDRSFREQALELEQEYFADVEYEGEIVRAKIDLALLARQSLGDGGSPKPLALLHEGGDKYIRFPITKPIEKWQKNPGASQRFGWMNSVINCTHYIYGEGEGNYLKFEDFPNVKFIEREKIKDSNFAWLG